LKKAEYLQKKDAESSQAAFAARVGAAACDPAGMAD
jgi:hypothetical protein